MSPRLRRLAPLLLVSLAGAALVAWNLILALRCPLWVVNQTPEEVVVSRAGEVLAKVPVGASQAIPLGEGRHGSLVERRSGREEVVVELRRGFLERFADRSVFVLNAASAAALRWEEGVYASGDDVAPPREARLILGFSFTRVDDVDLEFTPLPDVVTGEGHLPRSERLTALQLVGWGTAEIAGALPRDTPLDEKLRFFELRLPLNMLDQSALDGYALAARGGHCEERAIELLRRHLGRRPVAVGWHRVYQDLLRERGQEAGLLAEYARLARAEPDQAALEYLLGRLQAEPADAEARYRRALELQPNLAWPLNGLAHLLAARGEVAPAAEAAWKSARSLANQPDADALAYQLRLLAGQVPELQAELLASEKEYGPGGTRVRRLMEVFAAAGDTLGAREACARFVSHQDAYTRRGDLEPAQRVLLAELTLAELEAHWDELLSRVDGLTRPRQQGLVKLVALLEVGRLEEAEALLGPGAPLADAPREALVLSLAWSLRGDAARAERWREAARARYATGLARERLAAKALAAPDPLPELVHVALPVHDQAALLLALAAAHPERRAELLARAAPLVARGELYPARFLRRAHASLSAH